MHGSHAVVAGVFFNGYFAQDLMSDVDVIFCLHERLQLFTMEEKESQN